MHSAFIRYVTPFQLADNAKGRRSDSAISRANMVLWSEEAVGRRLGDAIIFESLSHACRLTTLPKNENTTTFFRHL